MALVLVALIVVCFAVAGAGSLITTRLRAAVGTGYPRHRSCPRNRHLGMERAQQRRRIEQVRWSLEVRRPLPESLRHHLERVI